MLVPVGGASSVNDPRRTDPPEMEFYNLVPMYVQYGVAVTLLPLLSLCSALLCSGWLPACLAGWLAGRLPLYLPESAAAQL
jgi:hypothetical protein